MHFLGLSTLASGFIMMSMVAEGSFVPETAEPMNERVGSAAISKQFVAMITNGQETKSDRCWPGTVGCCANPSCTVHECGYDCGGNRCCLMSSGPCCPNGIDCEYLVPNC